MKSRELFETYFEVLRHSQLTVYNPVASLEFPVDQFILAIKEVETLLNSKLEGSESRVGIIAGNSPFFLSTLLGIWASHRSAVLISPSLRMSEALKLSEVANLKHFFICNAYHATWTKQSSFPSIDKVSSLNYDVVSLYRSLTHVAPSDGLIGEEAVVLFSSGSTAQPKGIRISSKISLRTSLPQTRYFLWSMGMSAYPYRPCHMPLGCDFRFPRLYPLHIFIPLEFRVFQMLPTC